MSSTLNKVRSELVVPCATFWKSKMPISLRNFKCAKLIPISPIRRQNLYMSKKLAYKIIKIFLRSCQAETTNIRWPILASNSLSKLLELRVIWKTRTAWVHTVENMLNIFGKPVLRKGNLIQISFLISYWVITFHLSKINFFTDL